MKNGSSRPLVGFQYVHVTIQYLENHFKLLIFLFLSFSEGQPRVRWFSGLSFQSYLIYSRHWKCSLVMLVFLSLAWLQYPCVDIWEVVMIYFRHRKCLFTCSVWLFLDIPVLIAGDLKWSIAGIRRVGSFVFLGFLRQTWLSLFCWY